MDDLVRQSPVQLPSKPANNVLRDHWVVVTAYEDEGPGPWLVDLSHKSRWDIQSSRLDEVTPAGIRVPETAGRCRMENRILVNRMNRTQAAIWHLGDAGTPQLPPDTGYTDVTESTALLALLGPQVLAVAEKLTALDFADPHKQPPFLLQGPFSHVGCQIVILDREKSGAGAFLLACPRGYSRDMAGAVLHAGEEFGLRPAGEDRFTSRLSSTPA